MKCEKRKNKLADLSAKRIFCLRDILNVQEKETLDQVDNLAIEMAKDKAEAL